jgi:phosphoglycerate-specific signal transduction histidine kinase
VKEVRENIEKLQQAQNDKMATLGQCIGSVAHEINNAVVFICGNITVLK